jgi:hypothetical protein
MAEHKIQGGDYLLKINDDTVVCLTSVSLNDSVTVVDASSACGPDKSPGSLEISISFEGQHLQDPLNGKISGTDLRTLLRSETTIGFELGPILPEIGDEVQTGTGFISELSSTYAFDAVGTFTGTIQCYGMPSTNILTLSIGLFLDGGYVCYIDGSGDYYIVANELTNSTWGDESITTGVTDQAFLSGITNTPAIISAYDPLPCAALTIQNEGAGWYMPTTDDLFFGIITNWNAMPFIPNTGTVNFWSSCEKPGDGTQAWFHNIETSSGSLIFEGPSTDPKSNNYKLVAYKKINL